MTFYPQSIVDMSNPKELLAVFDSGLAEAFRAINELGKVSIEDVDLLDLYAGLEDRVKMLSTMKSLLEGLHFKIGAERHHRWATSERFYVYISERYGKAVEASLTALGEASGSPWHDLRFAAKHWKRMEEDSLRPNLHRRGEPPRYWIMAYDPNTGRIRKVDRAEIDAALADQRTS